MRARPISARVLVLNDPPVRRGQTEGGDVINSPDGGGLTEGVERAGAPVGRDARLALWAAATAVTAAGRVVGNRHWVTDTMAGAVGPGRSCLSRHLPHVRQWFLELSGITRSGVHYLPGPIGRASGFCLCRAVSCCFERGSIRRKSLTTLQSRADYIEGDCLLGKIYYDKVTQTT